MFDMPDTLTFWGLYYSTRVNWYLCLVSEIFEHLKLLNYLESDESWMTTVSRLVNQWSHLSWKHDMYAQDDQVYLWLWIKQGGCQHMTTTAVTCPLESSGNVCHGATSSPSILSRGNKQGGSTQVRKGGWGTEWCQSVQESPRALERTGDLARSAWGCT